MFLHLNLLSERIRSHIEVVATLKIWFHDRLRNVLRPRFAAFTYPPYSKEEGKQSLTIWKIFRYRFKSWIPIQSSFHTNFNFSSLGISYSVRLYVTLRYAVLFFCSFFGKNSIWITFKWFKNHVLDGGTFFNFRRLVTTAKLIFGHWV